MNPEQLKKERLIQVANVTDLEFCHVEDGIITHLGTGAEIPIDHMRYQLPVDDGFYRLARATCGENSGCYVGKHKETCSSYSKTKCAVYYPESLDSAYIKLTDVLEMLAISK